MTGQSYRQLPEIYRLGYASGFHQGLAKAAIEPSTALSIARCTAQWTLGQAQAVVDKYINDNPQRWHEWIGNLAWDALLSACRR